MISELLRGLPAGAALGILIAGGIAYYAGGELGERRAIRLYHGPCVQGLTRVGQGGRTVEDLRARMAQQMIDRLKRSYGPLWNVMRQSIDIEGLVGQAMAVRRLENLNRQRVQANTAVGRCQCAIRVSVREDTRVAHAVYIGSLRLIKPVSVAELDKGISGVLRSGRCGKEAS